MNLLQAILSGILTLWIIIFLFSWMIGQRNQYLTWTWNALRYMFQHAWQLILGIAIGYYLAAGTSVTLYFG